MDQGVQTSEVCRTPSATPAGEYPALAIRSVHCGSWVASKLTQELRKQELVTSEGVLSLEEIAQVCRENDGLEWLQARASAHTKDWRRKLDAQRVKFEARTKNASLYVPADVIVCRTEPSLRASTKNGKASIAVANIFGRRLITKLLGERISRSGVMSSILHEAGYKHYIKVDVVRGLAAPGGLQAAARVQGAYHADDPPVLGLESKACTPSSFAQAAALVLAYHGYISVEGRKAFAMKDANGENSWYFDALLRTFGDAVAFMSYVLSLTSPILPNGFLPDLNITFREKKVMVDGQVIPAGVDGSGTYHPRTPELQAFLKGNMATFKVAGKKREAPPVIQIRVWNPDSGLFAKGLIVPDENSFDENGQPAIVLGLNQIKGTMKNDSEVLEALSEDTSVVLTGHLAIMKVWKEQSTLKSCFELLQLAKWTPETADAVRRLVKGTFDSMRKRGIRGLMSDSSNGNTTLDRLIALVTKAQGLGVKVLDHQGKKREVSLLDIDAVRKTAIEKLRRRLYNAANGTGFEGNQVVMIMDASVKRRHAVIGASDVKTPAVGDDFVFWRFPAILGQSLKTLTVQEPHPHMKVGGHIVPYAIFMHPDDVKNVQGDDDGDIGAVTDNEDVKILANNLIDNRVYQIEPDGQKVSITPENMADFSNYLAEDPMGPVGQATVAQARFYELSQIGERLFWAYRFYKGRKCSLDAKVAIAEGALDKMEPHEKKLFDVSWASFRNLAFSWARAFGVFIQESIDRAKRFVRWTDIPKLARAGDKAWKAHEGSEELYCHWTVDGDKKVRPYKTAGLESARSENYMPLSDEQLRAVDPLALLKLFLDEAKEDLGKGVVNNAVTWRRNFTPQGEKINKRIDPDAFADHPWYLPGLVEEAYAATREEWLQVAKEFEIPERGADLSRLLEDTLEIACPDMKLPDSDVTWSQAIKQYKAAALLAGPTQLYAYGRMLWTNKEGEVDEFAASHLRDKGLLPRGFLPQAKLDDSIRKAMGLGNRVQGDSVLDKGHNEDEDPGKNPRIVAIEDAYAVFNREMSDIAESRGIAAILAAYAMEVANRDLHIARDVQRKGASVTSYGLLYGRPQNLPHRKEMQPDGTFQDVPVGHVVAKMDRALDLALFKGSPIVKALGLVDPEACMYEWEPDCRKAAKLITEGYSTDVARVEALAKAIFSTTYAQMSLSSSMSDGPTTIDQIAEAHYLNTGVALHSCEACTAALRKEVVNFNRYGKKGSSTKGDRLENLAAGLAYFLQGKGENDAGYADRTHFNTLREKFIRAIGKLGEDNTPETFKLLEGLKDDDKWMNALSGTLYDMARLTEHAADNEVPSDEPVDRSALALYATIFGLKSVGNSFQITTDDLHDSIVDVEDL